MKHPTSKLVLGAFTLMLASGLVACSESDPDASSRVSSAATTPAPSLLPRGAVDPVSLPIGPSPATAHVVGRTVVLDGRRIRTDLPRGANVQIMGSVDGLVVLTGQLRRTVGARYWAVDTDGRAEPLGEGAYESYSYPAGLVEETGHIWVHSADRGTGRSTTWAIDVRTGEELLELRNGEVLPPGLDPADRAVVAVYQGVGDFPRTPPATSPDGAAVAKTRALGRSGSPRYAVVVRRAGRGEEITRFVFARGAELADLDERRGTCLAPEPRCDVFVSVGTPVWEDDEHVLVTVGLIAQDTRYRRADVEEQTIVRCDLDGTCERASDLAPSVSLGVDPGF